MKLPPWMWRVLRSKRTRKAAKVGLCVGVVVVGGFYPVANWWGAWACGRAEAEIRSRGYIVPEGEVPTRDLEGSFYFHDTFKREANLPEADRLFGYDPYSRGAPRPYPAWSVGMASGKLTRAGAEAALASLAVVETRRRDLLAAIRQSSPLSDLPGNDWIVLPPEAPRQAVYDIASFLGEHAILTSLCGDREAALDEFEVSLRLLTEIRDPRILSRSRDFYPYDRIADEIGRLSRGLVVGTEPPEWSEPQLARLEAMLADFDFPSERTMLLDRLPGSYLWTHREIQTGKLPGPPNIIAWLKGWDWAPLHVLDRLMKSGPYIKPRGMYELERARALRELAAVVEQVKTELPDLLMEPIFVPARRFEAASGRYGKSGDLEDRLYFSRSLQSEILQQPLSLARHVIALERHRLRHGEYPPVLHALDSDLRQKLPRDPLTGEPPQYIAMKRSAKVSFQLGFAKPGPNSGVDYWKNSEVQSYQPPWR